MNTNECERRVRTTPHLSVQWMQVLVKESERPSQQQSLRLGLALVDVVVVRVTVRRRLVTGAGGDAMHECSGLTSPHTHIAVGAPGC